MHQEQMTSGDQQEMEMGELRQARFDAVDPKNVSVTCMFFPHFLSCQHVASTFVTRRCFSFVTRQHTYLLSVKISHALVTCKCL